MIKNNDLFVNRQLATRDGRTIGNAIITFTFKQTNKYNLEVSMHELETNFGSTACLSYAELKSLFYLKSIITFKDREGNVAVWKKARADKQANKTSNKQEEQS